MMRFPIFLAAIAASTIAVTTTVDAAEPTEFNFRLTEEGDGANIRADFRRVDREHSQWNSTFRLADLAGLERSQLRAAGQSPVQFAVVRDAGRLDCAGTGASGKATGRCRFTADQAFVDYLRTSGVTRLSGEDAYAMTAVGVRRDLVTAIRQASYPAPSAENLIALSALGADREYIDDMSGAGYRPESIERLIEFRALGITPDYIAGMKRIGFGQATGSQLVQFKALGIDAEYIESVRRAGYTNLPPSTLVEFKALGITESYIDEVRKAGYGRIEPSKLVQMKALGIGPADLHATEAKKR
jgi:hypothetical protein